MGRGSVLVILDANPIISIASNGHAVTDFLRTARRQGRQLRTTEAIVAQVWRGSRDANVARLLKAMEVESRFGDGRAIGLMCADEADPDADPDVVDASLAWWGKQSGMPVLSADPDVRRYAERIGAHVIDPRNPTS